MNFCTLLDIKNKVLPLTEDANIALMAEMMDDSIVEGEASITKSEKKIKKLFYKEQPKILDEVKIAIREADLNHFQYGKPLY